MKSNNSTATDSKEMYFSIRFNEEYNNYFSSLGRDIL